MSGLTAAIIGSFRRHYAEVVKAIDAFEAAGIRVVSPVKSTITNPGADFVRFASDPLALRDHEIQDRTLATILTASFVYAVIPDGYLGRTTGFEFGHVRQAGVPLFFSDRPPSDLPVDVDDKAVMNPADLAAKILQERTQALVDAYVAVHCAAAPTRPPGRDR